MIIDIWEPRRHDDCVLVDVDKVNGYTEIRYTKTNDYPGIWWAPGDIIKKYPTQPNGGIQVYQVPRFEFNQWPGDENE